MDKNNLRHPEDWRRRKPAGGKKKHEGLRAWTTGIWAWKPAKHLTFFDNLTSVKWQQAKCAHFDAFCDYLEMLFDKLMVK